MKIKDKAAQLVAQMTMEEKAGLCSGADFWLLKSIPRLGLDPIMVSDGPHGLRKQVGKTDHIGLNTSVPATCFPTASAAACSFNPALLEEVGYAIGQEALDQSLSLVLGPGVNQKRSPLCGRNFEYFSEDPLLSGELGAAWIMGLQKNGVGCSLKHYACNNQETRRMCLNALVDERALREIYLTGFEIAVKKAQPWTVMCAYNRINGSYCSENGRLNNEILRDEWGFEGLVVTDWGALCDPIAAVQAGVDLEMPGTGPCHSAELVHAVTDGRLSEAALNRSACRVTELILKAQSSLRRKKADYADHHDLAVRVAEQSAVLLQNRGVLPAEKRDRVTVIGAFAEMPRYQGAGSSKVTPHKLDTPLVALKNASIDFDYAPGYSLAPDTSFDEALIAEAVALAEKKQRVFLFAGLPEECESEGYDRKSLCMPESHLRLIDAVAEVNDNVTVVLMCGAPVELPFLDRVSAVLLCYLAGQGVGTAVVRLLYGDAVPSGKLAETFPLHLEDTPAFRYFPGTGKQTEYRESIFVGYRYYLTAQKPVCFPFGYGLSYTEFAYRDLLVHPDRDGTFELSFLLSNVGYFAGSETAQVYVGHAGGLPMPAKQLAAFQKVVLQPGEQLTVRLILPRRAFQYYHAQQGAWCVDGGIYNIYVGTNCEDTPLYAAVTLPREGPAPSPVPEAYLNLSYGGKGFSHEQFAALYGSLPPEEKVALPLTRKNTMGDLATLPGAKEIARRIYRIAIDRVKHCRDLVLMTEKTFDYMPLRTLPLMLGGDVTPYHVEGLLCAINAEDYAAANRVLDSIEAGTEA